MALGIGKPCGVTEDLSGAVGQLRRQAAQVRRADQRGDQSHDADVSASFVRNR